MRKLLLLFVFAVCLLPFAAGESLSASFTSSGSLPEGWTNEGWSLNEYLDIADDWYVATTYSTNVKLITPLLDITEGSSLSFEAYNPWDDSFQVYISADGETWTSLYSVPTSSDVEMKTYTVNFSASENSDYVGGQYYLAFMKAGNAWYNVYIDNITGPEIYSNDLDQSFTSSTSATPDGWSNSGWTLNSYIDIADDWYAASTYSVEQKLITPKLNITEGSSFSFDCFNNYDPYFKVYISADLSSWTEIYTIPVNTDLSMQRYSIDFSSESNSEYVGGQYYIAFMKSDWNYNYYSVYIDNISGPEVVVLNDEFEVTEFALLDEGVLSKVGATFNYSAIVTNNGGAEGSKTVYLTVGEDTVATATTDVIAVASADTVSLSWTPDTSYTSVTLTASIPEDDISDNNSASLSMMVYPDAQNANTYLTFNDGSIPAFWTAGSYNTGLDVCSWSLSSWIIPGFYGGYDGNSLKFGYTSYANLANVNFTSTLLDFSQNLYKVSFYMYRDGYVETKDSVNIRLSETPDTTGSTIIASLNRFYTQSPAEDASGWHYYEYYFDASDIAEGFLILEGTTNASGRNMVFDNLEIVEYQPYDAAITTITKSNDVIWGDENGAIGDIEVEIANKGSETLTAATIKWSIDGVAQTDINWTGSLKMDSSTMISIADSFAFAVSTIDTLDIEVAIVVDGDVTTANDSIATQLVTKKALMLSYSNAFEEDTLDQWLNIDADGDGYSWGISTANPYVGTSHLSSASFINDNGNGIVLSPDNWLITPGLAVTSDDVTLSYFVGSSDPIYFAEQYEILVSATGTDTANFERIFADTLKEAAYKNVTLALEGYKGQIVHLAIRHYGSKEESTLDIDSLTLFATPHAVSLAASPAEGGVLTGAGDYAEDATVTITAEANEGYRFESWTTGEEVVTTETTFSYVMGLEDTTFTANFIKTYDVSVFANIAEAGTVTIADTELADSTLDEGSVLTIHAVAAEGFEFLYWSAADTVTSESASYEYTVNADAAFTAIFDTIEYTIAATAGENGTLSPVGDVMVKYDSTATFTITANDGYAIADVLVDGESVGAVATYTFTNVMEDHSIEAKFEEIPSAVNSIATVAVSVYPNPFVDAINISSENIIKEVKLMDLSGKEFFTKQVNATGATVHLDVNQGVYMLMITDNIGNTQMHKIIKKQFLLII